MFRMGLRRRWLLVAALFVLPASAEAGVFRFEDKDGIVHYTNAPSDPRYRRLLGLRDSPASRPALVVRRLGRFAGLIRATADRYGVDRRLVEAVVSVESAGNPRAVSRKGAMGLMQLMPERSAGLGVRNPFDPEQNLDGGVRHLRNLLRRFEGDVTLALAAYNAGEEAVRAYGGVPPYPETRRYIRKVRTLYAGFAGSPARPTPSRAPQKIYRHVAADGTVTYTNVPPKPSMSAKR